MNADSLKAVNVKRAKTGGAPLTMEQATEGAATWLATPRGKWPHMNEAGVTLMQFLATYGR